MSAITYYIAGLTRPGLQTYQSSPAYRGLGEP